MAFLTGAYSNPATRVGAQNNDFGAVLQTDLTRVLLCLCYRLIYYRPSNTLYYKMSNISCKSTINMENQAEAYKTSNEYIIKCLKLHVSDSHSSQPFKTF